MVKDDLVCCSKHDAALGELIGNSPLLLSELAKIPKIARAEATVLILGETGTGKEICARIIHRLSPRAAKPFSAINCGAMPVELLDNELFGHRAGAFTGADGPALGIIGQAEGGTLFLDEIDSLAWTGQAKLLRDLQE